MDRLIEWVLNNKEWLFSGVGLVVIAWIGRVVYKRRHTTSIQNIQSGSNSKNIQAGRDVNISSNPKGKDEEEEK